MTLLLAFLTLTTGRERTYALRMTSPQTRRLQTSGAGAQQRIARAMDLGTRRWEVSTSSKGNRQTKLLKALKALRSNGKTSAARAKGSVKENGVMCAMARMASSANCIMKGI